MFRVGLGTVQGSRLPDAKSITPHDLHLFYVKYNNIKTSNKSQEISSENDSGIVFS